MGYFKEIDFDKFLDYFEVAKDQATRIRTRERPRLQEFYEANDINEIEIMNFIAQHPGCKITIIESGFGKGVYIYSWDTDNPYNNYAYKYEIY